MRNEIERLLERRDHRSTTVTVRLGVWLLVIAGMALALVTVAALLFSALAFLASGPLAHLNRLSIVSSYLLATGDTVVLMVISAGIGTLDLVVRRLAGRAIFLLLVRPSDSLAYLSLAETPASELYSYIRQYSAIIFGVASVIMIVVMVKSGPAKAISSLDQLMVAVAVVVLIPSYYFVFRFARFSAAPLETLRTLFSYPAILDGAASVLSAVLLLGVLFPAGLTRGLFPFHHWWTAIQSARLEQAAMEAPDAWRANAIRIRDSFITLQSVLPGSANHCVEGRVLANQLNVRSKPGSSYPVVARVRAPEKLLLLDRRDNWGKVNVGKIQGWISLRFVSFDSGRDSPFGDELNQMPRRLACEFGVLGMLLVVAVPTILRIVGISLVKALGLSLAGVGLEQAALACLVSLFPEHDWKGSLGVFIGVLISTLVGLIATKDREPRVQSR
jgi:hypothetical protein